MEATAETIALAPASGRKLTSTQARALQKALRKENSAWPAHLVDIDIGSRFAGIPKGFNTPVRAWRSSEFVAHLFTHEARGFMLGRLTINRTMVDDRGEWLSGIEWDTLMRLKREAGFGDHDALEAYPADGDVVNVANMRHLFLFSEPVAFIWRNGAR